MQGSGEPGKADANSHPTRVSKDRHLSALLFSVCTEIKIRVQEDTAQ